MHCRQMFSNQPSLTESLKRSLQMAALHRHRALLVLAGDANLQFDAVVQTFKQSRSNVKHVTIMHVPDRHSNSDITDQINSLLGSENHCLVFDAHVHFDERLFAASAATVVAGGLLILRTPPLDTWPKDSVHQAQNPAKEPQHASAFIQRFINKLISTSVKRIPHTTTIKPNGVMFICTESATHGTEREPAVSKPDSKQGWRNEQQRLVTQLQSRLQSSDAEVIVVQGDRGRGKSALIGRALNAIDHSTSSVTLTANRASSCKVLLTHASRDFNFLPVDAALQSKHDILIVEEAGSLPIAVLLRLMQLSQKIVFATTVQGYEGAGRGFAIRFAKQLNALPSGWLKLTPKEPIRWSAHDPVEAFVNDALVLSATTPSLTFSEDQAHIADNLNHDNPDNFNAANSSLRLISKQQMLDDDLLLETIFSLLISAHYQTTPSDLRHMLDEPQLHVYAQYCQDEMTGAALIATEGGIDASLHSPIINKQRRLPDQILPQVFAQACAEPTVLSLKYARIVRIAIRPELQRQGFGHRLFIQLKQTQTPDTIIGASFGADETSLPFWLSLACRPVHYGFKTNPRSGQRSVCVLFNEDGKHQPIIELAAEILHINVKALGRVSREPEAVLTQLKQATHNSKPTIDSAYAWSLISDYAQANRSFTDTVGLLCTHENILAQPTILEYVQRFLHCLNKSTPKQRREKDAELRQLIKTEFNL